MNVGVAVEVRGGAAVHRGLIAGGGWVVFDDGAIAEDIATVMVPNNVSHNEYQGDEKRDDKNSSHDFVYLSCVATSVIQICWKPYESSGNPRTKPD